MCGIYGYTGNGNAVDYVIEGLKRLEYRGYDSAGIAMQKPEGIRTVKNPGRVTSLEGKLKDSYSPTAIGHTRWATHGLPTEANAHPHSAGKFSIVHNGIIENFQEIKRDLIAKGIEFQSDTDSEVIAHLFNRLYKGDILSAAREVTSKLQGSYAVAVMCTEHPNLILAISKDSPLITGKGKNGGYLASDMNALQGAADEVSILSDGDMAVITPTLVAFYDKSGNPIKKKKIDISALVRAGSSSNYASHMLSEMYEIPRAVEDTINHYFKKGLPEGLEEQLKNIKRVTIVACGTAHNAGMAGKYMLERLIGIPVSVEYASEFRYGSPVFTDDTLVIAIRQSGETADTIAAVRLAVGKGVKVLSIVNVQGSTLTRCSDYVMLTIAGAEIAVAATKSYNCQITALSILAAFWSQNKEFMKEIEKLPILARNSLERSGGNELPYNMFNLAEKVFFIGRQTDYTVALEGSLKLKEISYIMSEGYAAGELKHGTLALIDKGTPVIVIITSRDIAGKTMNAVHEVQARGANVLLITPFEDIAADADCKRFIIPECDPLLSPVVSVIPLQFIAHNISRDRGCDPDRPRNLAKSVTVE